MEAGKVVEQGPAAQLFDRPSDPRTREILRPPKTNWGQIGSRRLRPRLMQSAWAWVLWHALGVTIKLSLVTFGASLVLSALLAAAGISPWRALRIPTRFVVDLLRSIPILALLIFVYYGLGKYTASWQIDPFWMAAIALTLGESAFLSEIFRAGIEAIPRSQWEAAKSLGFSWRRNPAARDRATDAPALDASDREHGHLHPEGQLARLDHRRARDHAGGKRPRVEDVQALPGLHLLGLFYLAVILPFTFLAGRVENGDRAPLRPPLRPGTDRACLSSSPPPARRR